jgi:hypothetical protein
MFKTNTVALPLAAGLIGNRLQGHTMNSKENPLQKAGYDYGDTLWGTGEGWGCFSPVNKKEFILKQIIIHWFLLVRGSWLCWTRW